MTVRPECNKGGGVSLQVAFGPYKKKVSQATGPKVTESYSGC